MYFWNLHILVSGVFTLLLVGRSPCAGADDVTLTLVHTNITRLDFATIEALNVTSNAHEIRHIHITDAPQLIDVAVQNLTLMPKLTSFYITQAPLLRRLRPLPYLPSLRTFIITTSGLTEVPDLSRVLGGKETGLYLQAIDLEGNHISKLSRTALHVSADQVSLNLNLLEEVPARAFAKARISKLSFRGNTKLKNLDENAFTGIESLRKLDLSSTAITSIPIKGLENLEVLKIEKTPTLKYIPSIYNFRQLTHAHLTHHFHCCAFAFPERHDPERHKAFETHVARIQKMCGSMKHKAESRQQRSIRFQKLSVDFGSFADHPTSERTTPNDGDFEMFDETGNEEFHEVVITNLSKPQVEYNCENFYADKPKVNCTPLPDALNPCEDVMGWAWLRYCVWFVITAAVVGNIAVLAVLLTNQSELTVPRFLMCHLAFSDLCTGIYLFMIAVIDLRSFGSFFNYAYDWQYGVGCKIAGFLSVFSGQLSVFTLSIVTLERWFAITYAIYLERRISLLAAAKIMILGWLFSIVMAGLPLVGVSDYSSTSICLPVESQNIGDGVYQGSLFMTNAVAWFTIVVCYVQIYRSLGGGGEKYGGRGAAAAAERRIANKMALLIGTNLLCWAPVAFFGVTALAGVPLVDVSHGKVLLVFFYPLNACANPFLYAILTKQYRRDFIMLIARTGKCNWLVEKYKLATTPPPTAATYPSGNPAPLLPLVDYQRSQSQISKGNGDAMF